MVKEQVSGLTQDLVSRYGSDKDQEQDMGLTQGLVSNHGSDKDQEQDKTWV